MALSPGDIAPDFTLTHRVGDPLVTMSDYAAGQPVVLLFFPLAFSGACTQEMCDVAERYDRWAETNAKVLGLSVDSPWVNVRFAEETGVPFPILSDFNKDVCSAYDVRNDDFFGMRGVSDRAAFVVDGSGVIRYVWTDPDADNLPPYDEIVEALDQL